MPDATRAGTIYLIRHAEKPDERNGGVRPDGAPDEESLSVRGWQRAGALVHAFDPRPDHLFASHSSSKRPQQTLQPIADQLGVCIDLNFGKGDETALADRVKAADGVVLICWQHEYMAAVASAILGDDHTAPQEWRSDRFDVTWIFERRQGGVYRLIQKPQRLLAGDSADAIA